MSNVVQFPKKNKRVSSVEDFQSNIIEAIEGSGTKTQFALETVNIYSSILMEFMTNGGIDVKDLNHIKDLALVLESLKGYVLKYYGIHHPINRLSDELFVTKDDGIIFLKLSTLNKITTTE